MPDNRDQAFSVPAKRVLDKASIIQGFAKGLEYGHKHVEPYLHYEFRPFSHELYSQLLGHLPDDSVYSELKHGDAIRPDGTSARLVLPISKASLSKMSGDLRDFWEEFASIICCDEIRELFLKRFEAELFKRFQCPLSEIPAIPKFMLMRDLASYKINIHHDIEWKTLTTQYYLPDDDSQFDLGTSIYKRDPDGKFVETHKMDFMPGNSYCFAVSKYSWHGVKPVGEIPRPRNSMMLIYFRDEGHDY